MAEVGLIVTADDKSTKVLKKIGNEGGKSLDKLKSSASALPGQFGQASAAMLVAGNASSQMGGKIGAAAGQVSQLGALVATGGPVGIALAASAALSLAGAKAWDIYSESARATKDAIKTLNTFIEASKNKTRDLAIELKLANEELRFLGKSQSEIKTIKFGEFLANSEDGAASLNSEIAKLTARNAELAKQMDTVVAVGGQFSEDKLGLSKATKEEIELNKASIETFKQQIVSIERRRAITKELITVEDESIKKSEQIVDADKRRALQADKAKKLEEEAAKAAADALAERLAGIDRLVARRAAAASKQLELDASIAQQQDATLIAQDEARKVRAAQTADIISQQFASITNEILDTQKTAEEKFLAIGKNLSASALQILQQVIQAKIQAAIVEKIIGKTKAVSEITTAAAVGGANAAAASAALGPGAVAIGLATAAAIEGTFVPLAAFQFGGIVTGGTPNRDSVPALLTPGEEVLTPRESRDRRTGRENGGGGRTINLTIPVTLQSLVIPAGAEARKAAIEFGKLLEAEVKSGTLSLALRS